MTISAPSHMATQVRITKSEVCVDLRDGRTISLPFAEVESLAGASQQERENWRIVGGGEGVHWPDLDEDLSVAGMLMSGRIGATSTGTGLGEL
ncbi:hypothetical protein ACI1US_02533 [Leucobacter sp. BZR 635]